MSSGEVSKELLTLVGLVTAAMSGNHDELKKISSGRVGRKILTMPVGAIVSIETASENGCGELGDIIGDAGVQVLQLRMDEVTTASDIEVCRKKTDRGGLLNEAVARLACLNSTIGDHRCETSDTVWELILSWRLQASAKGKKKPPDDLYNLVVCLRVLNQLSQEDARKAIEKLAETSWRSFNIDWLRKKSRDGKSKKSPRTVPSDSDEDPLF